MERRFNPFRFLNLLMLLGVMFFTLSCGDDDDDKKEDSTIKETPAGEHAEETIFMYMPWSGSSIYTYFLKNISSFESSIETVGGLKDKHFVVFIAPSATRAYLINVTYDGTSCKRDTLQTYTFSTPTFTTEEGISSIINDVKRVAPASIYSMLIGSHGKGWIPTRAEEFNQMEKVRKQNSFGHKTRYFGHSSDTEYQTDITTLASGIIASGIKMEYILFDDCYMSNVETAYDLKDATNYLIGSTSEIMIEGMPYATMGKYLMDHDYEGACQAFYSFYISFSPPCGTIAVTDCSQVEAMAYIMREINLAYPEGLLDTSGLQILDGYSPTIFFDFGDYVNNLCQDASLRASFQDQLSRLVPYKANTPTFYSEYTSRQTQINSYSGLTISDPSINSSVTDFKTKTSWYYSTH